MKITLRQLELFVAVANSENLTKSANELYLSQSAASMSLTQLESQLSTKLFQRIGKRLMLSAKGKELLPKALATLAQAREVEQLAKIKSKNIAGDLKIGASTTIGNYLMPEIISKFKLAHPEVNIQLIINNSEFIINELKSFKIDIGYIEGYCHEPTLLIEKCREDELLIFAAANHPLARKRQITKAELMKINWIMRERGSGTREIFEKTLFAELSNPNIALELGSSEAVKGAVLKGAGVGCLSRLAIASELASKTLTALPIKLSIKRNFYKLLNKAKYQTDAMQAFLKFKV